MTYLITGANGFIGSYLCSYLLQKGHRVIALSRNIYPEIRTLLHGAEFIEADITSPGFEKMKVEADVVVHLASSNDIVSKNLAKGIELSTSGTVNTLKLAAGNHIPKFIFYSTLQVYGTELSGNYSEETPVKPENDYAMNHLFGEMYVEMYARKTGIKSLIVRPSNIYGRFISPRINRWTLVPGCFVKEASEKQTITLLSSGNQNRNFISLEQLSRYTEAASQKMSLPYDVLNFASDDYKKIVDVARITKNLFEKKTGRHTELAIKSEQPSVTNEFQISLRKLADYGINTASPEGYSLESEISEIIKLLS